MPAFFVRTIASMFTATPKLRLNVKPRQSVISDLR